MLVNSPKNQRLEARISKEQKELIQYAASISGQSLTDFVVSRISEAAKEVIAEERVLNLHKQDQELFVQALSNPSKPNKALKAAVKDYQDFLKNNESE